MSIDDSEMNWGLGVGSWGFALYTVKTQRVVQSDVVGGISRLKAVCICT